MIKIWPLDTKQYQSTFKMKVFTQPLWNCQVVYAFSDEEVIQRDASMNSALESAFYPENV